MGPRVAETGLLTTVALVVIALLALVTVIGILRGMRLKRRHNRADRIERERIAADAGDATVDHAPLTDADAIDGREARPAPQPPAHEPVAPPPPEPAPPEPEAIAPEPIADEPITDEPIADEPIAAAAPLDASPASEAQVAPPEPASEPAPPPAPAGPPPGDDPVTRIKGLGPKVAALLAERGIVTVGQLAALDDRAAQDLDAHLGAFTGRMARDRWIEQARLLAAGDLRTFEERFGKL